MLKPEITIAMIVKDAEDTLARALNSIVGIAAQIIVVDTGSTDKTVRIASRYGAETHFFRWNNSFADARNYVLKFARKEWILVIDADEELNQEAFLENIDLLENSDNYSIRCNIKNFLKDGTFNTHKYPRLFRNFKNFSFEGAVHEQISNSIINAGYQIIDSEIEIAHYGYKEIKEEKTERNIELLKESEKNEPNDGFVKYHLGENFFASKEFESALENFHSALNTNDLSESQIELARIRVAQIYLSSDKFEQAEDSLKFASKDVDREGLKKYVLGAIETQKRNFGTALELFKSKECSDSSLVAKDTLQMYISELSKIA